jgi:multidrug efflux pump subunit AcrA (membrane-fusion protein)
VDTAAATRTDVTEYITVVGNLVGQATVDIVPRVAGRIDSLTATLGDRVTRGQQVAKIEDRELQQQVLQAEQSLEVNRAHGQAARK